MSWFRPRPKGRHALGAAVTSIPSGPVLPVAPVRPVAAEPAAEPVGQPDVMTSIARLIATGEAWTTEPAPSPQPRELPTPAIAEASRVQLGFRDGSTTALDPSSGQYQALEELAQSLTRRD